MASSAAPVVQSAKPIIGSAADTPRCAISAVAWRELSQEVAAWDDLADQACEPNPFFESWYLLPSLEAYDPRGVLRVLRFEHDGRLAGLLPLVRSLKYYGRPVPHLASWLHDNTFLGTPLVASGCEVEFWHAALGWADGNAGASLFLHLSDISFDGPMFAALSAVLDAQGRKGWIVQREERALLLSSLDAEQYRSSALSSNKRKDLRRRMNRLAELGEVRFVWQDDDAGIEAWCEQFLALEKSGWKAQNGSAMGQLAAKAAIFNQSLTVAAKRGKLLRLALHLNGNPVAMLSTFVAPPGAFGYKTAFDEQYGRYAPGVLLENEFLSVLDPDRFDWCDGCAAPDHAVVNELWRERRQIAKLSVAIGGPLRRRFFNQMLRFEHGKTPIGGHA